MHLTLEHNEKYDDEQIHTPWEEFHLSSDFYTVDKSLLLQTLSRDKRTAEAFLSLNNPSDKTIIKAVMRFASINAKHIAKRMVNIDFTEKDGINYAALEGKSINISLSSFCDHRVPLDVRFNTVAGLIQHELFHCRYTTPGLSRMLLNRGCVTTGLNKFGREIKVADFSNNSIKKVLPNSLFKDILNVLEDFRIEKLGLQEYPGYVFFFDDLRRYAGWRRNNSLHSSSVKVSDPLYQEELLLKYLCYKVLLPELLQTFLDNNHLENSTLETCEKIDKILETVSYQDFEDVYKGTDEIYQLFSKDFKDHHTSKTPYDLVEFSEEALEELNELIQQVMKELGEESGSLLDKETKKIPPATNLPQPYSKIDTITASIGTYDREIYQEALKISRSIKTNLAFLDSRFSRVNEIFELRHGEIDEGGLYSLKFKNRDLFCDEDEIPGYSLDIAILVDESGSMGGKKIREAQVAALAMALALKNNNHINLYVYGHTADKDSYSEVTMYRYLDPYNRANDINTLFSIESRHSNADGYAIQEMGKILEQSKARQKVLIVVSDGQPAARCYGGFWSNKGDSGIEHTAKVVKQLERQGVFVVQVAIGVVENSDKMFTHYIPYDGGVKLGHNLKQILNTKLVEISNQI